MSLRQVLAERFAQCFDIDDTGGLGQESKANRVGYTGVAQLHRHVRGRNVEVADVIPVALRRNK